MHPDELMARAAELAAQAIPKRETPSGERAEWPLERDHVALAFRDALATLGVSDNRIHLETHRLTTEEWNPAPYAIDLTLTRHDSDELWLAAELKVEEVDQCLWDLFKLTAAYRLPRVYAGYLVALATMRKWKPGGQCVELFSPKIRVPVDHNSFGLFQRNRKAWERLKKGGGARLIRAPQEVQTETLATPKLANYPKLEMRVVAVRVADWAPMEFGDNGDPFQPNLQLSGEPMSSPEWATRPYVPMIYPGGEGLKVYRGENAEELLREFRDRTGRQKSGP